MSFSSKGYGNVGGWLGLIMGSKMFVDFTKYPFDQAFKVLTLFFGNFFLFNILLIYKETYKWAHRQSYSSEYC